jgi:iron(III) transport system ATP-binding protein
VAVARGLVLEPQVLLFDEPLSNLDAKLRRRVRQEIRDLQQSLNLTVAYVTHDQEEALAVSDRIIVMTNARIAQEGTPHELYEAPANTFVADFIGDANLLDVAITSVVDGRAEVALGPARLSLPSRGLAVGPVKIAIRPQSLLVQRSGADNALPGTVRKSSYLGSHVDLVVATPVGELFVISPHSDHCPAVGETVRLAFAETGIVLVP